MKIEIVEAKEHPLTHVREKLFQGSISDGCVRDYVSAYRGESPWQECMTAAEKILELVRSGNRFRDITVVSADMATYLPLVNMVFHRMGIPLYQSGTENILQKSVISTVLNALDAALSNFDQRSVLRYLRSP